MPPAFIYFDFGNVISYFDRRREVQQVAQVSGVPEEKVKEVLLGPKGVLWPCEWGQYDQRQFHEEFCKATGSSPGMAEFLRADADIFTLNFSLLPLIANLEEAGYPLGILSNICESHWKFLSDGRYGIVPAAFDKIVLSYEAKAVKPDAKIFQCAIDFAGVPAQEILYIDDVAGHVAGAAASASTPCNSQPPKLSCRNS